MKEQTFKAHGGRVWRNSHAPHHDWSSVEQQTADRLLAGLRKDAANQADWFHVRAAELADELEAALYAAKIERNEI